MSIKAYSSYTVIDVVDGMQWQNDAASHPANPKEGWAYYNTVDKRSYIYDGEKWVVFSKDGSDGDGISYKYYLSNTSTVPSYTASTSGWSDEPQGVSIGNQYEYVVQIKTISSASAIASAKKINTHLRNFDRSAWDRYGTIGHQENWTTGAQYDNLHISLGDVAYVTGTVNGETDSSGSAVNAKIYGKVVNIVNNHITMISVSLVIGDGEDTIFTIPSTVALWAKWSKDGTDGNGISEEITQYCQSVSYDSAPISGWSDSFPTSWDKDKPYVWKRTKQTWTKKENGEFVTKYIDVQLMSEIEVATIMAQKSNKDLGVWCQDNKVSIIGKGMIATGAITANEVDTNGLQAEYIQSSNYLCDSSDSLVFTPRLGDTYKVGLKEDSILETIIIPQSYNGKQVVEIDKDSFVANKAKIIKKLAIPSTVTIIPFGFLEGYSVLEELHIPLHTKNPGGGYGVYFCHWFGMDGFEDLEDKLPVNFSKVYLSGRDGINVVPATYFDMEADVSSKFEVYLTPTITGMSNYAFEGYKFGQVYHYGQISATSNQGVNFVILKEPYVFPTHAGFRISSKDNNMINSPHFKVTQDGEVTASAADITGIIHVGSGDIAGWQIEGDKIHKDGVGMLSGDMAIDSLLKDGEKSPIRFFSGSNVSTIYIDVSNAQMTKNNISGTASLGSYKPINCNDVSASVVVKDGSLDSGTVYDIIELDWSYDADSYQVSFDGKIYNQLFGNSNEWYVSLKCNILQDYNFAVLEDGSLYASAANISLNDTSSSINVGTMSMCCNAIGDALLSTTGELKIEGKNGASIKLYGLDEAQTPELFEYDLYAKGSGGTHWLQLRSKTKKKVYHTETVRIMYKYVNGGELIYSLPIDFKIPSGSSESEEVNISPDVDYGSGYLWFVYGEKKQINVPKEYSNYSDGNPLVSDAIEFSQTETTQFVLIQGDLKVSGDVWSRDEKIGDSDRNIKNSILPLNQSHDQIFDSLKPVSYKFNNNTSNRTHTGLIAQDVKEAVENAGLTTQDFAAYCEWENDDGSTGCGLRYGEFISICIDQIQKLKKRVEELEDKLNNTQ